MCPLLTQGLLPLAAADLQRRARAALGPYQQVGEEEVGRQDALLAARQLHFPVKRQEPQWLVWLAGEQIIQVVTEHAHRSLNQFQRRRCGWALLHFHGLEQGLHGLAEQMCIRDRV